MEQHGGALWRMDVERRPVTVRMPVGREYLPRDALHKHGLCGGKMSVRLSQAYAGIVSKRLNTSSNFFHSWVETLL